MIDIIQELHENNFEVRKQHIMILKRFNLGEIPYFDEVDLINKLRAWYVGIDINTFNDEILVADQVCKSAKDWTPGLYRKMFNSANEDDFKWKRCD